METALGYAFKDKGLLLEALTHKSYHSENPVEAPTYNERLEFLGDSVLGLAIAGALFGEGRHTEAGMSKLKSHIVKAGVLGEIAEGLSLGDYLRIGRGEEKTGGRQKRSIIADALEAVIGAVYLDGGFEKARDAVLGLFGERISGAEPLDYKSRLQELTQARSGSLPEYRLIETKGKEHKRVFTVEVFIEGKPSGRGTGKNKKEAEKEAAKEALKAATGNKS